jgi:hypothetical protein
MAINQPVEALACNKRAPAEANNIEFGKKVGKKLRGRGIAEIVSGVRIGQQGA